MNLDLTFTFCSCYFFLLTFFIKTMNLDKIKGYLPDRRIILALVIILLLASFAYEKMSQKPEEAKKETKQENFILQEEKTAGEMEFFGSLAANKEADLSAKVSGRVSSINIDEGDLVRSGQFLAYLSPDQYGIDYGKKSDNLKDFEDYKDEQESYWDKQVKIAKENLEVAKEERDYYETHEPAKADIYEDAVDEAEAELKAAKKQRDAQDESLKEQSTGLVYDKSTSAQYVNDTKIMAPFGGVVTKKYLEAGEVVSAGEPVISVANMSSVKVVVEVPDIYVEKLSVGQSARVELDGISGEFEAKVTIIKPEVDPTAKKVEVEVRLNSVPKGAKVDMFARVFIKFPERSAFFVPNNFIFSGFEGPYVILENGKQQIVERGEGKEGETEIIFDGITNGIKILRNFNGREE